MSVGIKDKKSTAQMVLEACRDLQSQEQVISRETVNQVFNGQLTLSTIDDRLQHLTDTGELVRMIKGVYRVAVKHPPARLISLMHLPDGTAKLEIGDDMVVTLTPAEERRIGMLTMGAAMQLASIEGGRQASDNINDLNLRVKELTHACTSMKKQMDSIASSGASAQANVDAMLQGELLNG